MFILAGTCVFLAIVLGIMGLMAWGAMTTEPPTDNEAEHMDEKLNPKQDGDDEVFLRSKRNH